MMYFTNSETCNNLLEALTWGSDSITKEKTLVDLVFVHLNPSKTLLFGNRSRLLFLHIYSGRLIHDFTVKNIVVLLSTTGLWFHSTLDDEAAIWHFIDLNLHFLFLPEAPNICKDGLRDSIGYKSGLLHVSSMDTDQTINVLEDGLYCIDLTSLPWLQTTRWQRLYLG